MPFKPKTSKKIEVNKKHIVTLDSKHSEMIEKFNYQEEEELPKLKEQLALIKKKMKSKEITLDEKIDLDHEKRDIKKKIRIMKKNKKEYLLDNSKYIFGYFENKKSISEGNTKTKVLNSFFKTKDMKKKDNEEEKKHTSNLHKYLCNLDEGFININDYIYPNDICKYCKEGEIISVDNEGIMVCNKCAKQVKYLIENEKPSYKEPPKEVSFYAYKRINHFREILAQFQAKETTQIPDEVFDKIKKQIRKERIELKHLTNKKAKDILKKLGFNKYYEHIPFIKDKLGIKPPVMTPQLEETLCNLFMDIQAPYSRACPEERVNFLNYYYTVYKLCELLDQRQFLPFFPMLKDREKRIEQDEIWKKICKELDWEFIPTI
jgi:hypothetical protein